jgi:hypothetical protein
VTVRLIWAFPRSARGLVAELAVEESDCVLRLHDEYEPRSRFELRFLSVQGYAFTADALCTLDHVEAIDKVLELESSGWGAEVAAHRAAAGRPALHHYRMYVEGDGAYDVLAEAFLPDAVPRLDVS